jgi:hypothetical protein
MAKARGTVGWSNPTWDDLSRGSERSGVSQSPLATNTSSKRKATVTETKESHATIALAYCHEGLPFLSGPTAGPRVSKYFPTVRARRGFHA